MLEGAPIESATRHVPSWSAVAVLAIAWLAPTLPSCQLALDLGQYRLDEGTAGAAGSENAVAGGGAAGRAANDEQPGAAGASGGAGASGSLAMGNAGAANVGVDTRLPDGGSADAAAPTDASAPAGGCRDAADCTSAGECFEALCSDAGFCEERPRDFGFPCGDGAEAACTSADRCDGAGACQPNHAARGTPVSPPDGDCRVTQCDGQGQTEVVADNDDVPPDPGTGCSQPACLAGAPIQVPRGRGTPCEAGRCDGGGSCLECLGTEDCQAPLPFCSNGACVECTDATQCPDPRLQCNVAACDGGRCGTAPAPLPSACDDGFFCTLNDSCSVGGFCVGQQRQCPSSAPECSEELLRCVECTSDDQCEFSCDDQGTCRS